MRVMYRWTTWLAALAVTAALAACGRGGPPSAAEATPMLATLAVAPETVREEQSWDGLVEAVDEATLSAQTNARVVELPFDIGDVVPEGAVLVRFTDVEQKSAARAARAQVTAARAAFIDAQANYDRLQAVFARGLIARANLDQALATRDAARGTLAALQAQSRQVDAQQDYTTVKAPYPAIVTHRYVHAGEAVQSGPPAPQPLIAIASLRNLRVNVRVPQNAAAAIRALGAADILVDESQPRLHATRIVVSPNADPVAHTFGVRLELDGENAHLYPGMTVKAVFATGSTERLFVPAGALVQRGEIDAAYVVGADHQPVLRQLRLGERRGERIEVLAGLERGEQVARDPGAALAELVRARATARHD